MKRHNARILAMMTLYQHDIIDHSKMKEDLLEDQIEEVDAYQEMCEEEYNNLEIDTYLYNLLLEGVKQHQTEIDELISSCLVKWPLDRLSYVDRAILRIATYEMLFTKTPKQVIIDEALEITSDYVDMDDYPATKFNNKVLDTIKEKIIHG